MDNGKHYNTTPYLWRQTLPPGDPTSYPRLVAADDSELLRIRASRVLWDAYGKVVGERGRSADLREYMEWRIDHPDDPLPGRWRGPANRTRMTRPETES